MKNVLMALCMMSTIATHTICEIQSDSKWQNLDEKDCVETQKTFGGKWILAATITFKKKISQDIYFNMLDLEWQGVPLSKLNATLFRCDPTRMFVPIEENVVADGTWSEHHQTLHFSFKEKERLQTTHTFGLVLTIPSELEQSIKKGHFNLIPATLPQQLQESAQQHPLHVQFMLTNKKPVVS